MKRKMMMVTRPGGPTGHPAAAAVSPGQGRVDQQRLHQLCAAGSRVARRQWAASSAAMAGRSARGDPATPGRGCGGRRRRRLLQLEDLGAADDAAQRKDALSDRRLDRLDKTESTDNAVSARLGLHRRLRRHTDDALQPHSTPLSYHIDVTGIVSVK